MNTEDFLSEIAKCKSTTAKFITFLKAKKELFKIDTNLIVKLHFAFLLGIFTQFLQEHNIGFHADKYCYVIYIIKPNEKSSLSEVYIPYKIYESEEDDILQNYMNAIIEIFNKLENPF